MKRMLSAILGFAALAGGLAACSTATTSMEYGEYLYRKGSYVEAADAFSDAITLDRRDPAAWSNRGAARVRVGDLTAAISDYNRAIELAPRDADLYYNRGNALVAAGNYQAAISDFTRALELNPTFAKAMFNRGTAYAKLAQPDAAQTDWARAADLEPDPWTKAAMRRSAGLETPVTAVVVSDQRPIVAPAGPPIGTRAGVPQPPDPSRLAATPPVPPAAPPRIVVAPSPSASVASSPSASVQMVDSRALAARAITREIDGDHAGAVQDLNAALALETDPARRAAIANLIRQLERPR
jgi:tetratricopeptide (TPR) repeat protein